MAIDDDGSEEAVGAEKSPRNVRRFVWALMLGVLVLLTIALLVIHHAGPALSR